VAAPAAADFTMRFYVASSNSASTQFDVTPLEW
jgi:hypothetical protein